MQHARMTDVACCIVRLYTCDDMVGLLSLALTHTPSENRERRLDERLSEPERGKVKRNATLRN